MNSQPSIVIEEILGRSEQGVTLPFICRGDDCMVYYVKGAGAGCRSLICEWVAARLAVAFGLPVPVCALAEVPAELIDSRVRPDIRQLGAGVVFASSRLLHVQELSLTTCARVPLSQALDVLVFDWWLRNADRTLMDLGGNPNLLWDVGAGTLWAIAHNQAFDRGFSAEQFLACHVFRAVWNRVYGDHEARYQYELRMKSALELLPAIRDSIPESWWWLDDDLPAAVSWDEIEGILQRIHRHDFWNIP